MRRNEKSTSIYPVLAIAAVFLFALAIPATAAAPPGLINYQGVLRDDAGRAIDGAHDMIFRLYDAEGDSSCNGGTLLLTDAHEAANTGAVAVQDGLFSVAVGSGSITPGLENILTAVFRDHAQVFLEVTVAGEKLCPRVQVLASGFALNADHLDGKSSGQFLRSDTNDTLTAGTLTISNAATLDVAGTFETSGFTDRDDPAFYLDPSNSGISLKVAGGISVAGASATDEDHIYFDDGSQYLKWYETYNWFTFSNDIHAFGSATVRSLIDADNDAFYVDPANDFNSGRLAGSFSLGYFSGTDDDYLYFDANSEWIRWWEDQSRFLISDDLQVGGTLYAFSFFDQGDTSYYLDPDGWSNMNFLRLKGDRLYLNYDGPDRSTYLHFYDEGSSLGESLSWNETYDEFRFTDDLYVSDAYTGIEAQGTYAGGIFTDSDSTYSCFGRVGYADYGVYAQGSYRGGYFYDSDESVYLRAATGTNTTEGNGSKNFVQNHPYDPGMVIVYSALEGPEAGTYTRGSARLSEGEARVPLDETFAWVTNPDIGLTAHLTPRGEEPVPLSVVSLSSSELVVHGPVGSDSAFDFLVHGLRIGFEEAGVLRPKDGEAYIPSMEAHRELQRNRPELRAYTPLERYKSVRADLEGLDGAPDLSASRALRDAVVEWSLARASELAPPGDPEYRATDEDTQVDIVLDGGDEPAGPGADTPPPEAPAGEPTSGVTARLPMDADGNVYARSFRPSASDMASLAAVSEPVEAGDVLVIDAQQAGAMSLARRAADTAVFGIVAAEPGVVLGSEPAGGGLAIPGEESEAGETEPGLHEPAEAAGAARVPVSLSGVALCKVDAGYGSILPGDLLTTSPTAGHAMRADEPSPGTILGKALEPLDVGTGQIRVLVMLR